MKTEKIIPSLFNATLGKENILKKYILSDFDFTELGLSSHYCLYKMVKDIMYAIEMNRICFLGMSKVPEYYNDSIEYEKYLTEKINERNYIGRPALPSLRTKRYFFEGEEIYLFLDVDILRYQRHSSKSYLVTSFTDPEYYDTFVSAKIMNIGHENELYIKINEGIVPTEMLISRGLTTSIVIDVNSPLIIHKWELMSLKSDVKYRKFWLRDPVYTVNISHDRMEEAIEKM